MEIISNGILGKKYCYYCDSVVKLSKEDIHKRPLEPIYDSFWRCPVCGMENKCLRRSED